jgi:hypothetical protein
VLLLGIRFIAELLGLAALGYWGANQPIVVPWRAVPAIAAPLGLAVAWGILIAPKADNPLPLRWRELIGTALLLLTAAGLALAGQPGWGMALAAVVVADQALILALGLDGRATLIAALAPTGAD